MQTRNVAKALLVAGDKILILRRSETDDRRPLQWDFPGGAIDPGEDMKQACAREIQEEAGLTVAVNDLKTVYAMSEPIDDQNSGTWLFFKADIAEIPVEAVVLSYEHDQARWATLDEVLELFTYPRHQQMLQYVKQYSLLTAAPTD